MNVYLALIFFSASALSAVMAGVSILRSGGDAARITLGVANFPILVFTLFTAVLYLQGSARTAVVLFKLSILGIFFYGPLILNLFYRLRGRPQKSWIFLINLAISLFFTVWAISTDDFILAVEPRSGMWAPVFAYAKPWLYLALAKILSSTVNVLPRMWLWGRESKRKRVKFQSVFLFLSCLLGAVWGSLAILFFSEFVFFYQLPLLFALTWVVLRGDFLELNYTVNAEAIIENIGEAVFILRTDLFIHRRNAAAKRIVPEGVAFFPSVMADAKRFSEKLAELEADGKGSAYLTMEFKNDHNSRAKLWLSAIRDNFGDVAGFLVICREDLGIPQFRSRFGITAKEMEIIELVLEGMSNRRIAERLSLAVRTVETHIFKAYNRLNVRNRIELLSVAAQYDIHPTKMVEKHNMTNAPKGPASLQ